MAEPLPLYAELFGSDCARCAGVSVFGPSPVLTLCRRLVAAGHDPALPMEVYRGATLALRIRSIGDGAGLTVKEPDKGRAHFAPWKPFSLSPVARNSVVSGQPVADSLDSGNAPVPSYAVTEPA